MIEQIKKNISKNKGIIEEYRESKDILSNNGHWGMGYYEGMNIILEDFLRDFEEGNIKEVQFGRI